MDNQFSRWYYSNPRDPDGSLARAALQHVVAAVEAGEITTLDGVRSPLAVQISEHHGLIRFEMNANWVLTSQDWQCPCCLRTKFEVSRVGTKGQILAKLVIHHDHMSDALKCAFNAALRDLGIDEAQVKGRLLIDRIGRGFSAYEEVLICEDCNNADSSAKLRLGLPESFSFSVGQIRELIRPVPHAKHELDLNRAKAVWGSAESAYRTRIRLINDVAKVAATNCHWYEPHENAWNAVPLFGQRFGVLGDGQISEWLRASELGDALGRDTSVSRPNLSQWRTTKKPRTSKDLPENFLAILCSEKGKAEAWASVPDDWSCPVCKRDKRSVVEVADDGALGFNLKGSARQGGRWSLAPRFCNNCFTVFSAIKREVLQALNTKDHDTYAVVSPADIEAVIIARPNSSHEIRKDKAASLMDRLFREAALDV